MDGMTTWKGTRRNPNPGINKSSSHWKETFSIILIAHDSSKQELMSGKWTKFSIIISYSNIQNVL